MLKRPCFVVLLALLAFGPARAEEVKGAALAGLTATEVGLTAGLGTLREKSVAELDAEFADYAALGMKWLRTDIYWSNVQAEGRDSYDWTVMDRVIDRATAHGLKVLPGVGTTPPWARSIPGQRSAPANPADYATFIGAAAKRYAPKGVHAWEIWNEPNLFGSWPPSPDPDTYARLLIAASAAIRQADPDALVLLGGLSPVVETKPGKYYGAVDFLEAIYASGAGDAFDAVGFHPYTFPRMPDDPADWTGWSIMTGPLRAAMAKHGDADKKIWITEYGAPTNAIKSKVDEAKQAEMLTEAIRLARGYDWAGPLFIYSYRDLGTDPANNEDWFGLRRADGGEKPSYDAVRSAVSGGH